MKNILLLLLFVFITQSVYAATYMQETGFTIGHDIDNSEMIELGTITTRLWGEEYIGVGIGHSIYIEEGDEDYDYNFLTLVGKKIFTNKYYFEGAIRYNNGNTSNITYNLSAVVHEGWDWQVELFTGRSMIDSHAALDEEIFFNSYGVTADYTINDQFSIVGLAMYQDATDGNVRLVQLAQLVYSPKQLPGFYIKGRGKFRQADFNPPEYFCPEDFKRYDLLFGYRTVFGHGNWVAKGELGPGLQFIDHVQENGYEYKIAIEGWITQSLRLEVVFVDTHDSGDYDYDYKWGNVTIKYYW